MSYFEFDLFITVRGQKPETARKAIISGPCSGRHVGKEMIVFAFGFAELAFGSVPAAFLWFFLLP